MNKAKKFGIIAVLGKRVVSMSFLRVFNRNPVVDSRSETLRE
ncbi:MAG: hypothetical protein WA240_13965 [Nitrospirota bacterium]